MDALSVVLQDAVDGLDVGRLSSRSVGVSCCVDKCLTMLLDASAFVLLQQFAPDEDIVHATFLQNLALHTRKGNFV